MYAPKPLCRVTPCPASTPAYQGAKRCASPRWVAGKGDAPLAQGTPRVTGQGGGRVEGPSPAKVSARAAWSIYQRAGRPVASCTLYAYCREGAARFSPPLTGSLSWQASRGPAYPARWAARPTNCARSAALVVAFLYAETGWPNRSAAARGSSKSPYQRTAPRALLGGRHPPATTRYPPVGGEH
jgi:hypothetical protein